MLFRTRSHETSRSRGGSKPRCRLLPAAGASSEAMVLRSFDDEHFCRRQQRPARRGKHGRRECRIDRKRAVLSRQPRSSVMRRRVVRRDLSLEDVVSILFDAAGRRRSPATVPGYRSGCSPRNKGRVYPADPPRVEETIAVMRAATEGVHGARVRALVVILWRAGLRINEALTLAETDLEPGGERSWCRASTR